MDSTRITFIQLLKNLAPSQHVPEEVVLWQWLNTQLFHKAVMPLDGVPQILTIDGQTMESKERYADTATH